MKKKNLLININSHGEYGTERETRVSFFQFFFFFWGGAIKNESDLILSMFLFLTRFHMAKGKIKNYDIPQKK